jgi:hypothetical protein
MWQVIMYVFVDAGKVCMYGDVVGGMAGLVPSFRAGWSEQWRWFEFVFQAEVKRSSGLGEEKVC